MTKELYILTATFIYGVVSGSIITYLICLFNEITKDNEDEDSKI